MKCVVCQTDGCARAPGGNFTRYDCYRCGSFVLSGSAEATIEGKLAEAPIRRSLMSHALRRMQLPDHKHLFTIKDSDLESFWSDGRLPTPQEQANKLILWIGDNQPSNFQSGLVAIQVLAATLGIPITENEAGDFQGWGWLDTELADEGLYVAKNKGGGKYALKLTMKGWNKYADLKKRDVESRTAFMAMKFGDAELDSVVEKCFKPAVEKTGFQLRRLVDGQPAGLIDNQLRAAILSSRFLIADLSHGNQGAYWEAGFAEGLELPVIYTCNKEKWKESKTHFDTNHMVTIVWDPADLDQAAAELRNSSRDIPQRGQTD